MPMRFPSARALLAPVLAIMVLAAPQAALADPDEWGRERAEHRDDWRRGFHDDRDDWREEWRERRGEWRDRRGEWKDRRGEWWDDRKRRDYRDHRWDRSHRFDRHAFGGFDRYDHHRSGRHHGGHAFGFPPRRHFGPRHGFPPRRGHFHGGPPWSR